MSIQPSPFTSFAKLDRGNGVKLMAVELQIFYPNSDRESELIPITSTSYFKHDWLPLAEKLGLKLVSWFNKGLNVKKEEIQLVIAELDWLEGYIQNEAVDIDPATKTNTLSNIHRLTKALKEAKAEAGEVDLWFY